MQILTGRYIGKDQRGLVSGGLKAAGGKVESPLPMLGGRVESPLPVVEESCGVSVRSKGCGGQGVTLEERALRREVNLVEGKVILLVVIPAEVEEDGVANLVSSQVNH